MGEFLSCHATCCMPACRVLYLIPLWHIMVSFHLISLTLCFIQKWPVSKIDFLPPQRPRVGHVGQAQPSEGGEGSHPGGRGRHSAGQEVEGPFRPPHPFLPPHTTTLDILRGWMDPRGPQSTNDVISVVILCLCTVLFVNIYACRVVFKTCIFASMAH